MRLTILFILFGLSLSAQQLETNQYSLGLCAGLYRGTILGIDFKTMRPEHFSFFLQGNYFKYGDESLVKDNKIWNSSQSRGITLKPGISFLQKNTENKFLYLGAQGVVTYTKNTLTLNYNDGLGTNSTVYSHSPITFGAELIGGFCAKFNQTFYLETAVIAGIKPSKVILPNPEIPNYNAYYGYAPTQGFSNNSLYMNVKFGIGILFN